MTSDFISIPARSYELGWRYSDQLTDEMREAIRYLPGPEAVSSKFSPRRKVTLEGFEIASSTITLADLIGNPYELEEEIDCLEDLCNLVELRLGPQGLRLATEDELEAACGGTLFPWGHEVPDGIPYPSETNFSRHRQPTSTGLLLLGNPYEMELVRTALKLGDGGGTICGGSPWPAAWFALSPSYRLTDDEIHDTFVEHLEETYVRPVRLAREG